MEENSQIKVSILVPICNVEKFLGKCLSSIVAQTLQDIEIICINDGSKDNSLSIINEFASKDDRIVVIDKPNSGYGDSMSKGLKIAKGEYVGIVESDDFVDDDMFEYLYHIAQKTNADIVRSDYSKYWESKGDEPVHFNFADSLYEILFTPAKHPEVLMLTPAIWTSIYKRSFLLDNHIAFLPTPGASYQDTSFFIKTVSMAKNMYLTRRRFLHYRQDNAGSSVKSCALKKALYVNEEYKEAESYLKNQPDLFRKVGSWFLTKKLSAYFWNLNRIDDKAQYFVIMASEIEGLHSEDYHNNFFTPVQNRLISYISQNYIEAAKIVYLDSIQKLSADSPVISIIMPVYNAEEYLAETLDSLENQTFKNLEIICVDDGSKDNSLKILNQYAKNDDRIHVLHQNNTGAGEARNHGMSMAKGEYLMFLDCDDVFASEMVEKLYVKAKGTDSDVVICRSDRFDNKTKKITPCQWTIKNYLLPKKSIFKSTDVKKDFFNAFIWWPWDKIYKKSYIDNLGIKFQNLRTTNDLYFVAAATVAANKITYIDDVLIHQRSGLKSSLSVTREKSWDCFYKALLELRNFLVENELYDRFHQDFVNYAALFAMWHLNTLHGYTYCLLYKALKAEWFKNLDISGQEESYFYDKKIYKQVKNVINQDLDFVLIEKITELEQKVQKQEDGRNKQVTVAYHIDKMHPKISVIIPVYNDEKYLSTCLDSVFNQVFKDFEVICVNDGSTDSSLDILNHYSQKYDNFKFISQTNQGQSSARNKGLEYAKGSYILFLDGDDFLEPETLGYLYNESEMNELDILYFDAKPVFETKALEKQFNNYNSYYDRPDKYKSIYSGSELFAKMLKDGTFRMSPVLQLINHEFLKNSGVKFYEGIIHEDNLFSTLLLLKAHRVTHRNVKFYLRTIHENSTMTKPVSEKNLKGYYTCARELLKQIPAYEDNQVAKGALLSFINSLIGHVERIFKNLPIDQRILISNWDENDKRLLFMFLMGRNLSVQFLSEEELGLQDKSIPSVIYSQYYMTFCKIPLSAKTALQLSVEVRNELNRSHRELSKTQQELNWLKLELRNVKSGYSFRIGRVITFIPRKVRGGRRCLREHGWGYTFRRTLWHLGLISKWHE